ncbi:MAG: hypothetical protein VB859_01665 [Planctomycetaceae bacterium]
MKTPGALRPSVWLSAAVVVLWLVLAGPAWWLAGRNGIAGLSYSAALCLVPGWLVFFLNSRYRVADTRIQVILIATTFRLLFVAAGTLVVLQVRPELRLREFLVWIIVFYLATLVVETALLLRSPRP